MQSASENQLTLVETRRTLKTITSAIEKGKLTQIQVANATGIDQSQVSRILSGKYQRVSKNIKILCKYAEKLSSTKEAFQQVDQKRLTELALKLWDGSPEQAELLSEIFSKLLVLQNSDKGL